MRLIDGDVLWEKLDDEPWYDNADRDEIALPIVAAAPTADVVPVVHGQWVSVAGKRDRICSRCLHNEPYKNADDDAEVFEFCPHCGAKMDGGDSDEAD